MFPPLAAIRLIQDLVFISIPPFFLSIDIYIDFLTVSILANDHREINLAPGLTDGDGHREGI
jgi:hypothetical protein